ncbi:hypothetical protein ACPCTO_37630 [Streptomyces olivoreticuli]
MRMTMKLLVAGLAVIGCVGLTTPAGAAPRTLSGGEAVVNCVDSNGNHQIVGDNLAILEPLAEQVTEPIPSGTTSAHCTNSILSSEAVTITPTSTTPGGQRSSGSVTLNPGVSGDVDFIFGNSGMVFQAAE